MTTALEALRDQFKAEAAMLRDSTRGWMSSDQHNAIVSQARICDRHADDLDALLRVPQPSAAPALLQYMNADTREARSAAFLRTYAARVRDGSAVSWEIPNTVASTLEDIAALLESKAILLRGSAPQPPGGLSFTQLTGMNRLRCEQAFHSVDSWAPWE